MSFYLFFISVENIFCHSIYSCPRNFHSSNLSLITCIIFSNRLWSVKHVNIWVLKIEWNLESLLRLVRLNLKNPTTKKHFPNFQTEKVRSIDKNKIVPSIIIKSSFDFISRAKNFIIGSQWWMAVHITAVKCISAKQTTMFWRTL